MASRVSENGRPLAKAAGLAETEAEDLEQTLEIEDRKRVAEVEHHVRADQSGGEEGRDEQQDVQPEPLVGRLSGRWARIRSGSRRAGRGKPGAWQQIGRRFAALLGAMWSIALSGAMRSIAMPGVLRQSARSHSDLLETRVGARQAIAASGVPYLV